ncbi:S8/S53 family peptidase [Bradyrhizobium rifense]|uniref:S8/S53 family peptidase n=1 Tax=Bradyrhizobium rifense TaxID=515499 RepID=A0A5D3KPJ5_9BRAD|nr:S53 family peptidase [Bradyrhizobium rifense]TYL98191.1 S8/S53 family peptidase [Bradyrhizobium rifense]
MPNEYMEIPGSYREPPAGPAPIAAVRAVNPAEQIEVSVYVKDRDEDPLLAQGPIAAGQAASAPSVRQASQVDYSADFARITKFASENGLSVVKQDPSRRLVKLAGPADKLEAAFRTKLHYYNDGAAAFRARTGALSAPADVVGSIEAVLGLDTRPIAKPKLKRHIDPHAINGHLPTEIAKLYGFPTGTGAGQCIAIIELGGGFRDADNQMAFASMGLQTPVVTAISVSGGSNRPGIDLNADGEVALDIQVAGAVASGASIAVYFAPNTTQGFVDAITRAVNDQQSRPSVISISWGSSESNWTAQGLAAMNSALKDAAQRGVTVLAAAGDNLATDGVGDGRAHVDFPASNPYVLGCGGTLIDVQGGTIAKESVWNHGGQGTGGGISDKYPVPGYQSEANIPRSVNSDHRVGRGVPDMAADADPRSGYRVVVGGSGTTIGGTSAVAPLFAGLIALVNESAGRSVGFIHPNIYGAPQAFRQTKTGNNKDGGVGYATMGAAWNACTGLGAPDGAAFVNLFKPATAVAAAPPRAKVG